MEKMSICAFFKKIFTKSNKNKIIFVPKYTWEIWKPDCNQLALAINKYRTENNREPYILSDSLQYLAQERTKYNVEINLIQLNTISHSGISTVIVKARKYGLKEIGENLGYGYKYYQGFFYNWANSLRHDSLLLSNEHKYMGIGRSTDSKGRKVMCLIVGY